MSLDRFKPKDRPEASTETIFKRPTLAERLRAALGDNYLGHGVTGDVLRLHTKTPLSEKDEEAIRLIWEA